MSARTIRSQNPRILNNSDLREINIKREDKMFYDHKIFIVTWQRAASVEEVCKKLRISRKAACQKALYLRQNKVPVKKFLTYDFLKNREKLAAVARKYPAKDNPNAFDAERYIRVWQKAPSVQVAARQLGVTARVVTFRIMNLRRLGIDLKRFRMPRRNNVDQLKKIAHDLKA